MPFRPGIRLAAIFATNFNVLPEACWFTIDRRINPEEGLAEEKARLIDVLKECQLQGLALEWKLLLGIMPGRRIRSTSLAKAIHEVTGAPAFELCLGLLETRFYAARGVPSYAFGPGLLSVAHSERVRRRAPGR